MCNVRSIGSKELSNCGCVFCLVPPDATRKLNRERFDASNNPSRHHQEGLEPKFSSCEIWRAARILSSLRIAHKKNFNSIFHRFPPWNLSKLADEHWVDRRVFCKHLDELAQEDLSYVATWQERHRNENVWMLNLNSQGLVGPMRSRGKTKTSWCKTGIGRGWTTIWSHHSTRTSSPTSARAPILACFHRESDPDRRRAETSVAWSVDPHSG